MPSDILTPGSRAVLLAIKDGTTPPFKGAPLAKVRKALRDQGYITEGDIATRVTDKGYRALGLIPPAGKVAKQSEMGRQNARLERDEAQTKAKAGAKQMNKEYEELRKKPEAEQAKVIHEILAANETEEAYQQRKANRIAAKKAKKPVEFGIPVEATTGEELGYNVPYEYKTDKDTTFTFYRVYVFDGGKAVQITEHGSDLEQCSKRILQEYNRRNKTALSRRKPESGTGGQGQ